MRGLREDGHVVWRGIPYAQPPVGELQLAGARADAALGGRPRGDRVRDLVPPGADVRGRGRRGPLPGSGEDCLYLNVCAPAGPAPEGGRPVLFWLHGGGYTQGSGHQVGDGAAFADAGTVVVTVNYRLGRWGSPTSRGVRPGGGRRRRVRDARPDRRAALGAREHRGVRRRPRPDHRVRVSAGAKSVANLMASPLCRGMFAQAVSSSGGADHVATAEAGTARAPPHGRTGLRGRRRGSCRARRGDPRRAGADTRRAVRGVAVAAHRAPDGAARRAARPHRARQRRRVRLLVGNNAEEAATFALMLGPDQ
ncbi:carboxylesterase family protein [Streptomyces sp. M19]